ncbi:IS3 family transposase [Achromobacter spanius]|uniref:IS3 family transposase n=1 Tax=Achromobacter spanius TaxID=217203 RepID=UPI003208C559
MPEVYGVEPICKVLQVASSAYRRHAARLRTTFPDDAAVRPLDRVNRQFRADRPNQLWVSDFTYVSTWRAWLYVAFVIDVYARRIVGWRMSKSMTTDFVLDALEQALYARQPGNEGSLTHHSDRGSQYVSIRYSERLAEAGIEPSVGSRGQLRQRLGRDDQRSVQSRTDPPSRALKGRESVELAILEWVAWFNHKRLHSSIG